MEKINVDKFIEGIADYAPMDSNNSRREWHNALKLLESTIRGELDSNFISLEEVEVELSVIQENAVTATMFFNSEHDKRNVNNNVIKLLQTFRQRIKEKENA